MVYNPPVYPVSCAKNRGGRILTKAGELNFGFTNPPSAGFRWIGAGEDNSSNY